jgi:hypothetical protein
VEREPLDEFEQELRQALERRPAPPGLKRRILERRAAERAKRGWLRRMFSRPMGGPVQFGMWAKVAATLVIVAIIGGGVEWRVKQVEEQRKGEEARQQVLTALRITGHALDQMQQKLAAHDRGGE